MQVQEGSLGGGAAEKKSGDFVIICWASKWAAANNTLVDVWMTCARRAISSLMVWQLTQQRARGLQECIAAKSKHQASQGGSLV